MAFGLVAIWPYTKQANQEAFCQSLSIQEASGQCGNTELNLILVIPYTITAHRPNHSYPSILL